MKVKIFKLIDVKISRLSWLEKIVSCLRSCLSNNLECLSRVLTWRPQIHWPAARSSSVSPTAVGAHLVGSAGATATSESNHFQIPTKELNNFLSIFCMVGSHKTLSADAVGLSGSGTTAAVCSEWEPTLLPVDQIEPVRHRLVLARHSARPVGILCWVGIFTTPMFLVGFFYLATEKFAFLFRKVFSPSLCT
jgi:hypothetical protein